jgi:branched-chain amino acid transport system permease protein
MSDVNPPIPAGAWVLAALLLAIALLLPLVLPPFYLRLAQQILLFGGMAIGWSLLGGFTNYWSFGHTAFFGLGAFSAGLLSQQLDPGLSMALRALIGLGFAIGLTLIAAVVIAIPVLKLRGIYFAIAMLAFAEILSEISKTFDVFHGTTGFPLPAPPVPGLQKVQLFYFLFLLLFVVNVVVFVALRRSQLGTGLICVGQDEDTAAMLGIPTERYKLVAFVLSAVLTAIAGVVYGYSLGFISTGSVFRTDISLNLIVYSMLGGIGTVTGPVIGATIMIILTQVILGDLLDLHMMLTGAILIAMVILAPKGLVGLLQKTWSRPRAIAEEPGP